MNIVSKFMGCVGTVFTVLCIALGLYVCFSLIGVLWPVIIWCATIFGLYCIWTWIAAHLKR